MKRHALVLTGGGARAAYQVGALRAIAEITRLRKNPFRIISGFSAGAINGAWLASHTQDFQAATRDMWNQWAQLTADRVFETDPGSLFHIVMRWVADRGMGGFHKEGQITYLLNTDPLREFLAKNIDFKKLNDSIRNGDLHGFAVTATNYHNGLSTDFFFGHPRLKAWQRNSRVAIRDEIQVDHVMASAAIPVFFPPVKVGKAFYGDGMIRLTSPLSSAIKMGADRIVVIGIRPHNLALEEGSQNTDTISIGEIAGVLLSGLFFDSLDSDFRRVERINRTLELMSTDQLKKQPDQLRHVPILGLRPSEGIHQIPPCQLSRLPVTLRYLLRGIGITEEKGSELLSYLSFEPQFLQSLLQLGFSDTMKARDQVEAFFQTPESPEQIRCQTTAVSL